MTQQPTTETPSLVGTRWRSRDPRDNGKTVTVVVDGGSGFVTIDSGTRRTRHQRSTLSQRYELLPKHQPVEDHPLPSDLMAGGEQLSDPMESTEPGEPTTSTCVACGGAVEWVAAVDADGGWWDHSNRAAAVGPHRAVVPGRLR